MALRRPLVVISGQVKELPSGDALDAMPSNGTAGQVMTSQGSGQPAVWASPQITVSSTAPSSPTTNQLWLDIS